MAVKFKAHVDPGDPWRKWAGSDDLHRGNARPNAAAGRLIEARPIQLRAFVKVM